MSAYVAEEADAEGIQGFRIVSEREQRWNS